MIKKLSTVIATATLLSGLFAVPVFASNITITGNGSESTSTVIDKTSNSTDVNQSNNTQISIGVSTAADTGGNKNIGNTGGNSGIQTGNASSTTAIEVTGSSNNANVPLCGCNNPTNTITASLNGSGSNNKVVVKTKHKYKTTQSNLTGVELILDTTVGSGGNKNKKNTNGSNGIITGDTTSITGASITGSVNNLNPTPSI